MVVGRKKCNVLVQNLPEKFPKNHLKLCILSPPILSPQIEIPCRESNTICGGGTKEHSESRTVYICFSRSSKPHFPPSLCGNFKFRKFRERNTASACGGGNKFPELQNNITGGKNPVVSVFFVFSPLSLEERAPIIIASSSLLGKNWQALAQQVFFSPEDFLERPYLYTMIQEGHDTRKQQRKLSAWRLCAPRPKRRRGRILLTFFNERC